MSTRRRDPLEAIAMLGDHQATTEQQRAATLTCADHATNRDDLATLLDMLGLRG